LTTATVRKTEETAPRSDLRLVHPPLRTYSEKKLREQGGRYINPNHTMMIKTDRKVEFYNRDGVEGDFILQQSYESK
jgi:hypothetical protein